jgi:hypothetical protein
MLSWATVAAAQNCKPGMVKNQDTAGHCCWPGQAWSHTNDTCVGAPECPAGLQARGEECVAAAVAPAPNPCPPGQMINEDTAGHCCWPGQAWSHSRNSCVGGAPAPAPSAAQPPQTAAPQSPPPTQSPQAPQSPQAAAAPAPPGMVKVHVEPWRRTEQYSISVTPQQGPPASCVAPCVINLPPGPALANVIGPVNFQKQVLIPDAEARFRIKRQLPGLLPAGAFFWAMAGLSLVTGGVLCGLGACDPAGWITMAGGITIFGLLIGTPLLATWSQRKSTILVDGWDPNAQNYWRGWRWW